MLWPRSKTHHTHRSLARTSHVTPLKSKGPGRANCKAVGNIWWITWMAPWKINETVTQPASKCSMEIQTEGHTHGCGRRWRCKKVRWAAFIPAFFVSCAKAVMSHGNSPTMEPSDWYSGRTQKCLLNEWAHKTSEFCRCSRNREKLKWCRFMGGPRGHASATSESSFSLSRSQKPWLHGLTHTRLQKPNSLDNNRLRSQVLGWLPRENRPSILEAVLPSQMGAGSGAPSHLFPASRCCDSLILVLALARRCILLLRSLFVLPHSCSGLVL